MHADKNREDKMKKYLRGITALIIAVAILSITSLASAAGTVTITGQWVAMDQSMYEVTITWTGDASSGAVPDTAFGLGVMRDILGLYAGCAETDPGSTKPTDDYDITIVDEYGLDIYGGTLGNRDETSPEQTYPKIVSPGIYGNRPVSNVLTFKLANNSVASATGTVKIIFSK